MALKWSAYSTEGGGVTEGQVLYVSSSDPGPPGPAGPQGPSGGIPGSVWRNGTGAPSNSLGIDGDFYLDDATGNVYIRSAGTYSIVANIKGPQGDPGSGGGGSGGAVDSVNGQTGTVVLTAANVGADTSGAAATAQAAAIAASQPVDSDLTAIAALSTSSFGRALLTQADAAALRTTAGLGTAATQASSAFDAAGAASAAQAASQPLDSDLTAVAALSTTSFGRSFLTLADAAAGRTLLGLGTAATSASTAFDASGAAAAAQAASQPVDSDLTAIAALSTTSFGRNLLALADGTALGTATTLAGDVTGAGNATTLAATSNVESIIRANTLNQLAAPTANLTMNSQRILSLADAVLGTDAVTFEQLFDGWVADPNTWTGHNVPTVSGGTTTVATSLVTATAHGYSNGMSVIVSGFSNTTGPINGVLYYIVGVTTNTYQLSNTSGGSAITFGGTSDSAAITATGQNQFSVPIDATGYLTPGTKVSYNDGSVEFGVIRSAVNNSGTTTVTLITNSDFAIAAGTLTAARFSQVDTPAGFPAAFAWTPTLVGWSSNPTGTHYRWTTHARRIRVDVFQFAAGTSNAATHTITAPTRAAVVGGMGWFGIAQSKDNGTIQTGYLGMTQAAQVLQAAGLIATGLNTASGASYIVGTVEYEF